MSYFNINCKKELLFFQKYYLIIFVIFFFFFYGLFLINFSSSITNYNMEFSLKLNFISYKPLIYIVLLAFLSFFYQNSGVKISQVTYKNIRGTSASQVAMNFICSSSNPCNGIKLQNIRLTYNRRAATSFCANAAGFSNGVVIPRSCF